MPLLPDYFHLPFCLSPRPRPLALPQSLSSFATGLDPTFLNCFSFPLVASPHLVFSFRSLSSSPIPPGSLLAALTPPPSAQVFSWEFSYLTLFFSIHNFTQGVVLSTMGVQTTHYFEDPDTADTMAKLFSVILPMGFLPVLFCTMTGVSGFILNRPQFAFFVVSLMSCTYGALFLFPSLPCYLVLFTMFPVARQFVFSTFISFSASSFGYKSFGVINGLASTFAGLAQLLQNFLVRLVADDSTPFTWEQMDILMSLVPTVLLIPPLVIWTSRAISSCRARTSLVRDPAEEPLLHSGDMPPVEIAPSPLSIPNSRSMGSHMVRDISASVPSSLGRVHYFGSLNLSYGTLAVMGSYPSADQQPGVLSQSAATRAIAIARPSTVM